MSGAAANRQRAPISEPETTEAARVDIQAVRPPLRAAQSVAVAVPVIVTTLIFGVLLSYVHEYTAATARPAAVLRTRGASGLAGLWVAQTTDWVFLGRVDTARGRLMRRTGRIIAVPTATVRDFSFGRQMNVDDALNCSRALLAELADADARFGGAEPSIAEACPK